MVFPLSVCWVFVIVVFFEAQIVCTARLRSNHPALAHQQIPAQAAVIAKQSPQLAVKQSGPQPTSTPDLRPPAPPAQGQSPQGSLVKVLRTSMTKENKQNKETKQITTKPNAFHPFQSLCGNVHFLFNLPPDLKPGDSPRGLFIMLHACQRTASSFFALPEEAAMTTAVLRRGFAVAAPDTPPGRHGDCWDVLADGRRLAEAIPKAQGQLHLERKPLYAVGISSGGMLLASLVSNFKIAFSGLSFNVSPQNSQLFQRIGAWPRTSFVHAAGNRWAAPHTVLSAVDALKRRGTPVQILSTGPKPLEELPNHAAQLGIDSKTLSHAVDLLRWAGFTRMLRGDTPGTFKGQLLTPYSTDNAMAYLKRSDVGSAIMGHGGG